MSNNSLADTCSKLEYRYPDSGPPMVLDGLGTPRVYVNLGRGTPVLRELEGYPSTSECLTQSYRGQWKGKEVTLTKRGCSTMSNTDECRMKSDDERLEGLGVNFAYNSCKSSAFSHPLCPFSSFLHVQSVSDQMC